MISTYLHGQFFTLYCIWIGVSLGRNGILVIENVYILIFGVQANKLMAVVSSFRPAVSNLPHADILFSSLSSRGLHAAIRGSAPPIGRPHSRLLPPRATGEMLRLCFPLQSSREGSEDEICLMVWPETERLLQWCQGSNSAAKCLRRLFLPSVKLQCFRSNIKCTVIVMASRLRAGFTILQTTVSCLFSQMSWSRWGENDHSSVLGSIFMELKVWPKSPKNTCIQKTLLGKMI